MTTNELNGAPLRVVSYATRKAFTQPSPSSIVSAVAHFVSSVATRATSRQIAKLLCNGKRKTPQRVQMCTGFRPIRSLAQIAKL